MTSSRSSIRFCSTIPTGIRRSTEPTTGGRQRHGVASPTPCARVAAGRRRFDTFVANHGLAPRLADCNLGTA
jgi:hypothetical protein